MTEKHPVNHEDGRSRCQWPGSDPLYVAYHDHEWGVPEYDDRALFEKLVLDGFQAGLSWITILRRREAFRKAFDGFNPEKIIRYSDKKIEKLMGNSEIIRNRAKIVGTVSSAKAYLALQKEGGFSAYLWDFVDGRPIQSDFRTHRDIPAKTDLSIKMSKDLKKRGFAFCGPTIVYAFCQAVGIVNDHVEACFRREECRKLAKKPAR
ncbi:DNA-3-methyladenine glycosylase I [Methyloferula stellata]|uniref:DNA-3-methyladenine glycosylase I n=1 Tax=Methyloferula stellata TaxID=876270 RepID=UPI000590EDE0|nr:DNA-3-methyladenine glycosylase I [Methyloferula stellata]